MQVRTVVPALVLALVLVGCAGGDGDSPVVIVVPVLSAPATAGALDAAPTSYAWSSAGDGAQYRYVIVELLGHQSLAQAMENAPLFESTSGALTLTPQAGFPALEPGKAFVWFVIATLAGQEAKSLPFWFRLKVPGETVTRSDAMTLVVNRLITPATAGRIVDCFMGRYPLPAGTSIAPWDEPGSATVLASPSWFAWIDDDAQAFFSHDTRFVFIDVVTGIHTVVASEWWPTVDGVSCFNDDDAWLDDEVIVYSERRRTQ